MPHVPLRRFQVRYLGRVQGVGFRYTVQRLANTRNVVGWVRNEPDGSVAAELQADEQTLNQLLDDIQTTMQQNIQNVHTTQIEPIPGESTLAVR